MNALPEWVLWIQAIGPTVAGIATAAVAFTVGGIAYRQWKTADEQRKTANQKLVLDLFDRRFRVYELARSAVEHVNAVHPVELDYDQRSSAALANIRTARGESRFLFGNEVTSFLQDLDRKLLAIELARRKIAGHVWTDDHTRMLSGLSDFYEEFPRLARPYMQMHQKL